MNSLVEKNKIRKIWRQRTPLLFHFFWFFSFFNHYLWKFKLWSAHTQRITLIWINFFWIKKNSNEITSENLQKICHFISINLHQRKFEKRIIHQKWMWPKNKIKCAFFCLFAKFFLKVLCALTFAHIGRNQNQTDFWAPPYWSIWNWKKLKPKTKV